MPIDTSKICMQQRMMTDCGEDSLPRTPSKLGDPNYPILIPYKGRHCEIKNCAERSALQLTIPLPDVHGRVRVRMLQRLSTPLFLPHMEPESEISISSTTDGEVDVEGRQENDNCEIKVVEATESLPDLPVTRKEQTKEEDSINELDRLTPSIGLEVPAIENDDGRLDEAKLLEKETSGVEDQGAEGRRQRRYSTPQAQTDHQDFVIRRGSVPIIRIHKFVQPCTVTTTSVTETPICEPAVQKICSTTKQSEAFKLAQQLMPPKSGYVKHTKILLKSPVDNNGDAGHGMWLKRRETTIVRTSLSRVYVPAIDYVPHSYFDHCCDGNDSET